MLAIIPSILAELKCSPDYLRFNNFLQIKSVSPTGNGPLRKGSANTSQLPSRINGANYPHEEILTCQAYSKYSQNSNFPGYKQSKDFLNGSYERALSPQADTMQPNFNTANSSMSTSLSRVIDS